MTKFSLYSCRAMAAAAGISIAAVGFRRFAVGRRSDSRCPLGMVADWCFHGCLRGTGSDVMVAGRGVCSDCGKMDAQAGGRCARPLAPAARINIPESRGSLLPTYESAHRSELIFVGAWTGGRQLVGGPPGTNKMAVVASGSGLSRSCNQA